MSYSLFVHPLARLDILDAVNWYEEQRRGLGLEMSDQVAAAIGRPPTTRSDSPSSKERHAGSRPPRPDRLAAEDTPYALTRRRPERPEAHTDASAP